MDGPTALIPVAPEPPPVFVDETGRRQRRLLRVAYGVGAAGVLYMVLVGISFVGGPITPDSVIPFVEATAGQKPPPPTPQASPTVAVTPSATAMPPPARTAPARPSAAPATSGGASGSTGRTPTAAPSPSGNPARPRTSRPPATTAPVTPAPTSTAPTSAAPPPAVDPPDELTDPVGAPGD